MTATRRVLMASSVFAIALATGFVMQHGEAMSARLTGSSATPPAEQTSLSGIAAPGSTAAVVQSVAGLALTHATATSAPGIADTQVADTKLEETAVIAASAVPTPILAIAPVATLAPMSAHGAPNATSRPTPVRAPLAEPKQLGEVPKPVLPTQAPTPTPDEQDIAAAHPQLPSDPGAMGLPTPPSGLAERVARTAPTAPTSEALGNQDRLSPFGEPCIVVVTADPSAAAMIDLALAAPCYAGAPVTLTQGALRFTAITDSTGRLDLVIPALSPSAELQLRFDDGTVTTTRVAVPEAAEFDRVALQWQGRADIGLHALEFGATYGEGGHVHAGRPHAPNRAQTLGAGFLTNLGNSTVPGGWQAQVYSFPALGARRDGMVRISVEAEITTGNCARTLTAETIDPALTGPETATEIRLSMPDCSAAGDFLVLKNLLRDMRIAAN